MIFQSIKALNQSSISCWLSLFTRLKSWLLYIGSLLEFLAWERMKQYVATISKDINAGKQYEASWQDGTLYI